MTKTKCSTNTPVSDQKATEQGQEKETNTQGLVEKAYPEKTGFLRKVLPLWANYFRVNYHDPLKSNYISESFFVQVNGDEVVTM